MIITNAPGGNGGGSVNWTKIATIPAGTYGSSTTIIASSIDVGTNVTAFKLVRNNITITTTNEYSRLEISIGSGTIKFGLDCFPSISSYLLKTASGYSPECYGDYYGTIGIDGTGIISSIRAARNGSADVTLTGSIDIYYTNDDLF